MIFCGDAVYTFETLERMIIGGFHLDPVESISALKRIKMMAKAARRGDLPVARDGALAELEARTRLLRRLTAGGPGPHEAPGSRRDRHRQCPGHRPGHRGQARRGGRQGGRRGYRRSGRHGSRRPDPGRLRGDRGRVRPGPGHVAHRADRGRIRHARHPRQQRRHRALHDLGRHRLHRSGAGSWPSTSTACS